MHGPLHYAVLFNRRAPKHVLEAGDTFQLARVGQTDEVNESFVPMSREEGVPIQQLERIRVVMEADSARRMMPGDVIRLGASFFLYDGRPLVGGFSPIVRGDWLGLLAPFI